MEKFRLKAGKITEISSDLKRARVKNQATKLESQWLAIGMPLLPGNIFYQPQVGDFVVFAEYDENFGFVISKLNNSEKSGAEENKIKFSIGSNSLIWDTSSNELTIEAATIKLGSSATESMILGNSLKSILESVFLALSTHVHTGGTLPSGSTGPSDKATDFSTAYSNLSGILSTKNKVE